MRKKKGFTLIELVAAFAIIGMLGVVLWPVFANAQKKARAAQARVAKELQLRDGDQIEFVLGDKLYRAAIGDISHASAKRPKADRTIFLSVSFRKTAVTTSQGGTPDAHDDNGAGLDDNS